MDNEDYEVEVVLPESVDDDNLEGLGVGLVFLTKYLHIHAIAPAGGGGLGGPYGYGCLFENEVFAMHPYCWCERDDCEWCNGAAPNFWYKPLGVKVYWYKWIGRDMGVEGDISNWVRIINHCVESVEGSH